jgi:predicted XRE-type DNA-binding protein
MALAIHFDRLIREGRVADQSELARLVHVTQPQMTQIMNLNLLTPDIQEALLLLPRVTRGRDPIREKTLRPIAAKANWCHQRRA